MSVYPEFLQHVQAQGLYVDGYNYEEMYNIMVNNLTNNFIPSFCFIYSYDQMNELYDYLDNLLHSTNHVNDNENNEDNEPNQTNQNQINQIYTNDYDSESEIDSIYSDSDSEVELENVQTVQNVQTNQPAQQLLNNYLANLYQNNTNYYTNIIHYNNISNEIYTNHTNLYNITYLNNSTN
jgi:uncharacterized Zn finger protein